MTVDLGNFDLREGDILAGRFRVERLLGSGGMGVVVEATHVTLKARVALKFLRTPKFADQTTITRFLREAQAAARIKSPHVASVLDVGTLEDGSPYMVMEFLEGTDLGTVLEKEGILSVDVAVKYALQTCEALAAAHSSNVVHRDIKPSNLFLTQGPDGEPLIKVLDFGISKMLDGTTSGSITETQRAVGSPSYMAPEQMRSAKRVDARADIWSMGVVLYELLTGRAPFVAETIPELYALILDQASRPTPLRSRRPDVPEALERTAERCLEKDVEARFRDVAELALAIAPFGGEFGPISAARTRKILETASPSVTATLRSKPPMPKGPSTTAGARSTDVSPATVREGRPLGTTSRPDASPSSASVSSANPSSLTATSFAETQSPGRRPRRMLATSMVAAAVALVGIALVGLRLRSDASSSEPRSTAVVPTAVPLTTLPPAVVSPTHAAPPDDSAGAMGTPNALPAASAPSLASASPEPSSSFARPQPAPFASAPRTVRAKPAASAADDVLLHRK